MLFGKKENLVGLDIGSRTIKAAEISETNSGRSLKRFGMADIKPGLIEDGAIREQEVAIHQEFVQIIQYTYKECGHFHRWLLGYR